LGDSSSGLGDPTDMGKVNKNDEIIIPFRGTKKKLAASYTLINSMSWQPIGQFREVF